MTPAANIQDVLSAAEKETIHRNVLRVLGEIGMQIEHDGILSRLADSGLPVDTGEQRVRFPAERVDALLAACPKSDWSTRVPTVATNVGVYAGRYHVPGTMHLEDWRRETFELYLRFAKALPEVDAVELMGCPLRVPAATESLWERFFAWKCGVTPAGSLHPASASGAIHDLLQAYAEMTGQTLEDVFSGICYMISPLRLAAAECEQVWYWYEKGLQVAVGTMPTAGTSTPVTLAGHTVMRLAETFALAILNQVLFDDNSLRLTSSAAANDMQTMIRPFGRPEQPIGNAMMTSMARFYGVGIGGHSGLSDAKLPSPEAGAQKCMSALGTLLSGADASVCIGLLATDEVCSPVQAVLDCEYVRVLRRFLHEYEVTDESIGFDTIKDVGPGGSFMATMHTAMNFRDELYVPEFWERQGLAYWLDQGGQIDIDRAAKRSQELLAEAPAEDLLTPDQQGELKAIIKRASKG